MQKARTEKTALALAIAALCAGAAHAQVVGESSDTKVKIAASTVVGGPHSAGRKAWRCSSLPWSAIA